MADDNASSASFAQLWATMAAASAVQQENARPTASGSSNLLDGRATATQEQIDRLLSDTNASVYDTSSLSPAGFPPGGSQEVPQGQDAFNDNTAYVPLDRNLIQQLPLPLDQSNLGALATTQPARNPTGQQPQEEGAGAAPSQTTSSRRGRKRKNPVPVSGVPAPRKRSSQPNGSHPPRPASPTSQDPVQQSSQSQQAQATTRPASPKKVIPATSALPHLGRVRLAQRTSKGRTRVIERPPLPEWLRGPLTSGDEAQKAVGDDALKWAATLEYCEPMADRAEAMQTQLRHARTLLAQELSRAQIEEAILKHALNAVLAERRRVAGDQGEE